MVTFDQFPPCPAAIIFSKVCIQIAGGEYDGYQLDRGSSGAGNPRRRLPFFSEAGMIIVKETEVPEVNTNTQRRCTAGTPEERAFVQAFVFALW